MSRKWLVIIALVLLALALRLGWALSRPVDAEALAALPDQLEYLQAGRNLLEGEGFWFEDPRFGQKIFSSRTVGYPLLVAMCGGDVRVIQVVQCFLDISSALAIYLLARRWLSEWRSLIAMALVLFNPLMVYFCALVLSETMYVALLAWAVCLVARPAGLVWGILLAAAAVHVRPSGAPMAAALGAAGAALNSPGGKRILAAGAYAAIGVVATIVLLVPWALRNEQVLGEPIWLTTNGGITFYDGIHPGATGASDQRFVQQMPELGQMSEVERDRHLNGLAREQMFADPTRTLRLGIAKTLRTWSPVPLSEQFSRPLYRAVGLLYTLPLFVAALAGILCSAIPWRGRLLLLAPAIIITLTHALSVGSMRYRLPAEPMLAVLAAGAFTKCVTKSDDEPCASRDGADTR